MMCFTHDEIILMALYDIGTRTGLINELTEMSKYLDSTEFELRELTASVISKLKSITDDDYCGINLISDLDFDLLDNT